MTTPIAGYNHFVRSSLANIVGADTVIGCPMVDRHGKEIGQLHDVMIDLFTGRVAYAVIELRRPSHPAAHRVVVPWNAIHCDARVRQLRINAHADWILRAPAVQSGSAADRFVHEWGTLIHNYFGTRPYWEAPERVQQYS